MMGDNEQNPEISKCVAEWRKRNQQTTEVKKECEAIEKELAKLNQQHLNIASDWEREKTDSQNTVRAVQDQVNERQQHLLTMEKETATLCEKVQARRAEIDKKAAVIRAQEQAVDKRLKDIEDKENVSRPRLQDFRDARDVIRTNLQRNVEKIDNAIPKDAEEHRQRLLAIETRITEIESTIESEKETWEVESKEQWSEVLKTVGTQGNRMRSLTEELLTLENKLSS
jgi:chromosome segregation ATPase